MIFVLTLCIIDVWHIVLIIRVLMTQSNACCTLMAILSDYRKQKAR